MQPAKAQLPSRESPSGRLAALSPVQSRNAKSPTDRSPSGSESVSTHEQPWKALSAIAVTLRPSISEGTTRSGVWPHMPVTVQVPSPLSV